jgi:hypothetical protein
MRVPIALEARPSRVRRPGSARRLTPVALVVGAGRARVGRVVPFAKHVAAAAMRPGASALNLWRAPPSRHRAGAGCEPRPPARSVPDRGSAASIDTGAGARRGGRPGRRARAAWRRLRSRPRTGTPR